MIVQDLDESDYDDEESLEEDYREEYANVKQTVKTSSKYQRK
jgi:hypothetical protein